MDSCESDKQENKTKIKKWIKENKTKAFICRELKCKPSTLEFYLKKLELLYKGNQGGKGQKKDPKRKNAILIL